VVQVQAPGVALHESKGWTRDLVIYPEASSEALGKRCLAGTKVTNKEHKVTGASKLCNCGRKLSGLFR
jgi:hypothetical protein